MNRLFWICSTVQLQWNGLGELVSARRSIHSDPQSKRIAAELLFRCSCRGRYGGGDGNRDSCTALVTASCVDGDALDALAVGGDLHCHARPASVASLSVEECLHKIVLLDCSERPCGSKRIRRCVCRFASGNLHAHHFLGNGFGPDHEE